MKYLADTSALLAMILRDDAHHASAARWLRASRSARFVVSDLVVAELATRLRARAGAPRAVGAVRDLLRSPRYDLVFIDSALLDGALDRMERLDDKRLSLTDCTSFELMEQVGLQAAFTFDRDFRDCGFETVP